MTESTPEPIPRTDVRYWAEALGEDAEPRWILRDPFVTDAIEHGRWDALHALLRKRVGEAPSMRAREGLELLLADRRHFAEPVGSAPGMFTLNGIGTRLVGRSDVRPDGTFIGTLWFTLLFLPVLPLGQYLVADAPGGGWHFFGKVPISKGYRWWKRIALALLVLGVLRVATHQEPRDTRADVWFLNGLEVPVRFEVNGQPPGLEVGPGGRAMRTLEAGPCEFLAWTETGRLLEELSVEVPAETDVVAFNVLGAAPLYRERVVYYPEKHQAMYEEAADAEADVRCLAGTSWILRDDIDFAFQPAPRNLTLATANIERRSLITVAGGDWVVAVNMLGGADRLPEAAALARRVAEATPDSPTALGAAAVLTEEEGDPLGARRLLERHVADDPENVEVHRAYQDHLERQGQRAAAVERYRAAFEQDPDSPRAVYLYARTLPHAEAWTLVEPMLARFPDDRYLIRSAFWVTAQAGNFEEAEVLLEPYRAAWPEEEVSFLSRMARVLAGLGRHHEALRAVIALFEEAAQRRSAGETPVRMDDPWELIATMGSLRRQVNLGWEDEPTVREWVSTALGIPVRAEADAMYAAAARDRKAFELVCQPSFEEQRAIGELMLLSRDDIDRAARRAQEASPTHLHAIDDLARVSIACELDRIGEEAKAEEVLEGLSPHLGSHITSDIVQSLPTLDGMSEDLEIELQSALIVAAARRTDDPAERKALLARARRLDPLQRVLPD